jgi:orotate phosphoribosyltransferase
MTQDEVLKVFKDSSAYLDGHFKLTSGKHSSAYLEKMQVLQYPERTEALCKAMADLFRDDKIDVVIGPAVGGILLAYETARQLGTRGIFLERVDGKLTLRRGFKVEKGERALLVEDVVSTGRSVFELIKALKEQAPGVELVGVGLLVDRSGGNVDFGLPRQEALMKLDLPIYEADACPLCSQGKDLTQRGSRNL